MEYSDITDLIETIYEAGYEDAKKERDYDVLGTVKVCEILEELKEMTSNYVYLVMAHQGHESEYSEWIEEVCRSQEVAEGYIEYAKELYKDKEITVTIIKQEIFT